MNRGLKQAPSNLPVGTVNAAVGTDVRSSAPAQYKPENSGFAQRPIDNNTRGATGQQGVVQQRPPTARLGSFSSVQGPDGFNQMPVGDTQQQGPGQQRPDAPPGSQGSRQEPTGFGRMPIGRTPQQQGAVQQRPPTELSGLKGSHQDSVSFGQTPMGGAAQHQGGMRSGTTGAPPDSPSSGPSPVGLNRTPIGGGLHRQGAVQRRNSGASSSLQSFGPDPYDLGEMPIGRTPQLQGSVQQRPGVSYGLKDSRQDSVDLGQVGMRGALQQQGGMQSRTPPGSPGSSRAPVGPGRMPIDKGEQQQVADEAPAAVPFGKMEKIAGYDKILLPKVTSIAPPPRLQKLNQAASSPEAFAPCAQLSEQEARDLMHRQAKSECCWGTKASRKMEFRNLLQTTAVHYVLRTFIERRSTDWACEPYRGQIVDGSMNGQAPYPWQIQVQPPNMFQDATFEMEVPHTASVRTCHGCNGSAMIRCRQCNGRGQKKCASCSGYTVRFKDANHTKCVSCGGGGTICCMICAGRGRLSCATCRATGQVKYYVRLTTKFETHAKEFIVEKTPLPDDLIRDVPGTMLFEDTQPLLRPVKSFSEPNVNSMSAKFLRDHKILGQSGRILMQNHSIRGVPVFQCDVVWKHKPFQFFVYGENRAVYCENYPQTCCCSCEVL